MHVPAANPMLAASVSIPIDDALVRVYAHEISVLCALLEPRIKRLLEIQEALIELKTSDLTLDDDFEKFAKLLSFTTTKMINANMEDLHDMARYMLNYKLPLPVHPHLKSVA